MSLLLHDKRIRWAFAIAILEWGLVGALVVLAEGFLIWLVLGVATFFQMAILFWQPRPTGLFPEAQAAFMAGDYNSAQHKLETLLQDEPHHLQAQTLLGNTLRQVGDLSGSETRLRAALAQFPTAHFPLYGLARTRLAQGDFSEASQLMELAMAQGGRKAIQADLALSYYLGGDKEKALQTAHHAAHILSMEAYRVLMVNYLLYRLKQDPLALSMMERHQHALAFWQTEAARFAETPYGQGLASELSLVQSLLERETP